MPEPDEIEANAAAELLYPRFQAYAARLAPSDPSLQDDLTQEMALAVLRVKGLHRPRFYLVVALWRGKDYLKKERQHAKRIAQSEVEQLLDDHDEAAIGRLLEQVEKELGLGGL